MSAIFARTHGSLHHLGPLEAGNLAYKLLHRIGGMELIGPLLTGLHAGYFVRSQPSESVRRGMPTHENLLCPI